MISNKPYTLDELKNLTNHVEAAVCRAVRSALLDHQRSGDPVVFIEGGIVRWVPANQIEIPPPTTAAAR